MFLTLYLSHSVLLTLYASLTYSVWSRINHPQTQCCPVVMLLIKTPSCPHSMLLNVSHSEYSSDSINASMTRFHPESVQLRPNVAHTQCCLDSISIPRLDAPRTRCCLDSILIKINVAWTESSSITMLQLEFNIADTQCFENSNLHRLNFAQTQ